MPTPSDILVFDIWSDFAHFRKIETTTSPLTYFVPTPTVLSGLIGAIVGLERDTYYEIFSPDNVSFAIKSLSPLKKLGVNINLINTKHGFYLWNTNRPPRSPTPHEFIKYPAYRIYFKVNKRKSEVIEIYSKLKNLLENHQTFYTPYLGIAGMIAEFNFVGELNGKIKKLTGKIDTACVVRKDKVRFVPEEDRRYVLERLPLSMNKERVVHKFIDVIFEADNKPISIKADEVYEIGGENVVFL